MVDTIFNGGSSILASWHSKQSIWHQIVKANSRALFFQELFKKKKSTNSIKFPSASCKFWLHWSLSPYKLKYAEDFAEFLKHYRKPIPQSSTNLKPITCQKGGLNGSLKSYPGFLQRMKAALHLYPNANRSVHKLS